MITLNINPKSRQLIKNQGHSIKVRDNKGNYFGSELRVFFSKNKNSQFAVVDYDLPNGAGDNVVYFHVLDEKKNSIYRTRVSSYIDQELDEYLLS